MSPHSSVIRLLTVALALVATGCAAPTRIVLAPGSTVRGTLPLDVRVAHAQINRQRVIDALSAIDTALKRQSGGMHHLNYALNIDAQYGRQVSIHSDDMTVRSLLSEICRQADLRCEIDDTGSPYDLYVAGGSRSE